MFSDDFFLICLLYQTKEMRKITRLFSAFQISDKLYTFVNFFAVVLCNSAMTRENDASCFSLLWNHWTNGSFLFKKNFT